MERTMNIELAKKTMAKTSKEDFIELLVCLEWDASISNYVFFFEHRRCHFIAPIIRFLSSSIEGYKIMYCKQLVPGY